jgi:hypothetical protein
MPYKIPGYSRVVPFTEVPGYVYAVYHVNADSYHSVPEFPIAAFGDEEKAIAFAEAQGGYGVGIDWKVRPIPSFIKD